MIRLKEYRQRLGLTQAEAVAAIRQHALDRGDRVTPGLDTVALSRHENERKRPCPYYQQLYCQVYGKTPVELGFRLALPAETRDHDDVNRREFLAGAAGFAATIALPDLPAPVRLGDTDIERMRQALAHQYELDNLHGAGPVYTLSTRNFHRLRQLAERASYSEATGRGLHELTGHAAEHAGWLAYDAEGHEEARRWWLESMHWARLGEADAVSVSTMASMSLQAVAQQRPREAADLAEAALRTARSSAPTPRLTAVLLAREALGHAGAGNASRAHAALSEARELVDQPRHDDDPSWLNFWGPADFAAHERHAALMLGDYAAAENAARTALALNDLVVYPRNHALYLIGLANALVRRREIEESVAVANQAGIASTGLDSTRVTRRLRRTAQSLAPFKGQPGVDEFVERYARAVQ